MCPPKECAENLIFNAAVFGGGLKGKCLGHEGFTLMSE
jgi:hypothetical protein